jgi:hypothetical protein
MRALQRSTTMFVLRSENESGRVGLRLMGGLDLDAVGAEPFRHAREQVPSSVIDRSELRFLDLTGLRMPPAHMLDAQSSGTLAPPLARRPTTRVAAEPHEAGHPFVKPGAARCRAPGHLPDPLEHAGPVPAAMRR